MYWHGEAGSFLIGMMGSGNPADTTHTGSAGQQSRYRYGAFNLEYAGAKNDDQQDVEYENYACAGPNSAESRSAATGKSAYAW